MQFQVLRKLWGLNEEQLASQFFPTFVRTSSPVPAALLTKKLNHPTVLTADLKNHHISYEAYPFSDWRLHSNFENGVSTGGRITYVRIFITIGGLVLLLAVINYVNMATAKATTRAR